MSTELALTRPDPTMDEGTLRVMMAAADRYVKSGLLPASIKTPQQALIIMAQGRELGIPATVALRGIVVVQGKPTCSAELMMALVHRTYGQSAMRVFKTDNESCTVQYRQAGWDGISEYTFSMEDAKKAGLLSNTTWSKYPAAMLRARAISATVRFAFPECISGLYSPGEVGGAVEVVDGEVVPMSIEDGEQAHGLGCKAVARNRPDACDCGANDGGAAGPDRCDKAHWNRAWHAAVKGTRFENDETRHKFIAWWSDNAYTSLSDFLDDATTEKASDLISSVKARIEAEAKKARAELEAEARRVIEDVRDAGGSADVPDDLGTMSDNEIREMIDPLKDALRKIAQDAVPA